MAKNIELKVEGDELVLRIKLTTQYGVSASGKSIIIASSEGYMPIPGDETAKLNVNVIRSYRGR